MTEIKVLVTVKIEIDEYYNPEYFKKPEILRSTEDAIRNAVKRSEANGFEHYLEDYMSIEVVSVEAQTPTRSLP